MSRHDGMEPVGGGVVLEEPDKQFAQGIGVVGGKRLGSVGEVEDVTLTVEDPGLGLLKAREDGRGEAGLEIVDHHQGEAVGGEGLQPGLVDLVVLGPPLDAEDERSDPVVQLGVAVEQVSVPGTRERLVRHRDSVFSPGRIVDTEVHLQTSHKVIEFQNGHFSLDQLNVSSDEALTFLPEQSPGHGEPVLVREGRAVRVEAHVQVRPRPSEPVEGGAGHRQATLHLLVQGLQQLLPEEDLPVQQPPLLLGAVEQPGDVCRQPRPVPRRPDGLHLLHRHTERVGHGVKVVWVGLELLAELVTRVGEHVGRRKVWET